MEQERLHFTLTNQFFEEYEQLAFLPYLVELGLDERIWSIFRILWKCNDCYNRPIILRAYEDESLVGAIILLKCQNYGRSLFRNSMLWRGTDILRIPVYLWLRLGCGMDLISNPGFFISRINEAEIITGMMAYLNKSQLVTLVNDYSANRNLYKESNELGALPHAIITTGNFIDLNDYIAQFKNLKRKIRAFKNKGGSIEVFFDQLPITYLDAMKKCFDSTCKTSRFHLPYQRLYNQLAIACGKTAVEKICYFIALMNGKLVGYQATLVSGNHLITLHGAFDRNLKSTYHAYEALICKMVNFSIKQRLIQIDLGAVINHTKKRMINKSIPMSYFLMSKYSWLRRAFNLLISFSNIQSQSQLQFR